jgi:hypothetical protein
MSRSAPEASSDSTQDNTNHAYKPPTLRHTVGNVVAPTEDLSTVAGEFLPQATVAGKLDGKTTKS